MRTRRCTHSITRCGGAFLFDAIFGICLPADAVSIAEEGCFEGNFLENVSVHGAEHAANRHALDGFALSSVEDHDIRAERVRPGIVIRSPREDDWGALHELVRKVHQRTAARYFLGFI